MSVLCVRMRMAFWRTRGGEEGGREACEEAPSHPIPGFIHRLDAGNRHTALKPCPCGQASGERKTNRARGTRRGLHGLTEGQQRTAARRGTIPAAAPV